MAAMLRCGNRANNLRRVPQSCAPKWKQPAHGGLLLIQTGPRRTVGRL